MSVRHLNFARLHHYRRNWPWARFRGDLEAIHWVAKDLSNLDAAIQLTQGRGVAIQAGGNVGLFAKRLAEDFRAVYTFEPDAKLFACLEYNAPEPNIVPIMAALGNSKDPVALACVRRTKVEKPVHSGLTHIAGPGTIPMMKIDDLGVEECDLIYLDIEGYEMEALLGAEQTIDRFHPVIGVEINGNGAFYGHSKEETRSWIEGKGYVHQLRQHGDDIYAHGGQ